ncbi:MAG: T9SS type A sorting domain-containing protein [Bacteroidetes bacterium]|nr:T9SS type A sorting domain-containing protein [Bacteroidota bacterium]
MRTISLILFLFFSSGFLVAQECLQFFLSHTSGDPGDTVSVNVSTSGFDNIVYYKHSIHYDASKLELIDWEVLDLPGLDEANIGTTEPGIITSFWLSDDYPAGVSVPRGTGLYNIRFKLNGNTNDYTPIQFADTPTPLEAGTTHPAIPDIIKLSPVFQNGSILQVGNTRPLAIYNFCDTLDLCSLYDEDGVSLTITGGVPPYTYLWTGPFGFSSTELNPPYLPAGEYTFKVWDSSGNVTPTKVDMEIQDGEAFSAEIYAVSPTVIDHSTGSIRLLVSGGTPPHQINWSNGSTSENISFLEAGFYSVTISDASLCGNVTVFDSIEVQNIPFYEQDAPGLHFLSACGNPGDTVYVPMVHSGFESAFISFQSEVSFDSSHLKFLDINPVSIDYFTASNYALINGNYLGISWIDDDVYDSGGYFSDTLLVFGFIIKDGSTGSANLQITNEHVSYTEVGSYKPGDPSGNIYGLQVDYPHNFTNGSISIGDCPDHIMQAVCLYHSALPCEGSSGYIKVSGTGGVPPYFYNWTGPNNFMNNGPEIFPLETGWYYLTMTDQNGSIWEDSFLMENEYPEYTSLETQPPYCKDGGEIILNYPGNDFTDYAFEWNTGDSLRLITDLDAGTYTVTVTNYLNCESIETIELSEDDPAYSITSELNCSTNPRSHQLLVQFDTNNKEYEIHIDKYGGGYNASFDFTDSLIVPGLLPGFYFINIFTESGCQVYNTLSLHGAEDLSLPDGNFGTSGDILSAELEYTSQPVSVQWHPQSMVASADNNDAQFELPETGGAYPIFAVIDYGHGCPDTLFSLLYSDDDGYWPGDANKDGIVNHFDFLHVGLGYGLTGPGFPTNTDTDWYSHPANSFDAFSPKTNVDFKHADTDNSRAIDSDDTDAIWNNRLKTHQEGTPIYDVWPQISYPPGTPGFMMDTTELIPEQWQQLDIDLGTEDIPVENIYGIAFSIHFDPEVFSTVFPYLIEGWIYNQNEDYLGANIFDYDQMPGRIDCVLTKTNGMTKTASGLIASLTTNIKLDQLPANTLATTIKIDQIVAIDQFENRIPINGLTIAFPIQQDVAIFRENIEAGILVFPNPSSGQLEIQSMDTAFMAITITDMHAREVYIDHFSEETSQLQFDLQHQLPAGLYIIQLQTSDGIIQKKWVKE